MQIKDSLPTTKAESAETEIRINGSSRSCWLIKRPKVLLPHSLNVCNVFFFLLLFVGLGMRAVLDPSIMGGVQKTFKEPVRELTLNHQIFYLFFSWFL